MKAIARSLCLLALICIASSTAFSQDNDVATSEFTRISGKVVDSSNKPIEKFKVNIVIYDYTEGGWSVSPKQIAKWDGEFENGEFSFDVETPFEVREKTYISSSITAEGYLNTNRNNGWVQVRSFNGKIKTTKLSQAVKVRGQVVLPDDHADDHPILPKVYVTKKMTGFSPDWNNRFQTYANVGEDGKFEMTVPENCQLVVSAYASNAATTTEEFKIPKSQSKEDAEEIGEIKLKPGVSLSGVVLDRDGNPVEGQIVQIQHSIAHSRFISSTVYGHARSDANGKFTLPPRLGKCEISLTEQGTIGEVRTKAKGDVLMAKPIKLSLKEGVTPDAIEIKEGKTWKIHGTISYEGDKPSFNYSFGSGGQKEVELDSDGHFEFEVVDGVTPWIMMYKSGDGEIYMAKMSTNSLRKFRKHFSGSPEDNAQFFQLKKVSEDIGPLEFRMVKHIPETRTMMEMFSDWYFMNDD
jgi:hypothetical protein